MRVLFLHPNFPAQFRHVAAALGREGRHKLVFATKNERPEWNIPGVEKALYKAPDSDEQAGKPLVKPFADAVLQGESVYKLLNGLKAKGFRPDIIYGHSGWGTTLYIKEVFPETPFLGYFEWFYDPGGYDANFDPPRRSKSPKEKPPSLLRTRNAAIFNDLWTCDRGICPTHWQKSQFPSEFRDKLEVVHDGVDTDYFVPDENAAMKLPGLDLSHVDEIVTYASRGMEPYRGFPQFMQAVALLLKRRKSCHVVIAASERVCYGSKPKDGKSWKEIMLSKLDLDKDRLHFTGSLPYGQYKSLLQASRVHVYLTRPFVLSWSAVESMACGCSLVASDTPPVREALRDRESALLSDFFSPEDIALRIEELLVDRELAKRLSGAARAVAEERYSLKKLLPRHLGVIGDTARGRYRSG